MLKATGLVRKMDHLGRITLPIELRRLYELEENDFVEIFVDESRIILCKYQPACVFCGSAERLVQFKQRNLCQACRALMPPACELG